MRCHLHCRKLAWCLLCCHQRCRWWARCMLCCHLDCRRLGQCLLCCHLDCRRLARWLLRCRDHWKRLAWCRRLARGLCCHSCRRLAWCLLRCHLARCLRCRMRCKRLAKCLCCHTCCRRLARCVRCNWAWLHWRGRQLNFNPLLNFCSDILRFLLYAHRHSWSVAIWWKHGKLRVTSCAPAQLTDNLQGGESQVAHRTDSCRVLHHCFLFYS